jgi:hypothetical protein
MRKFLKWTLVGLLVLAAVGVAGGFLMPRTVTVARDIVIDAPPASIYPHVSDLRAFDKWAPWSAMDPQIKVTYSGAESGVGQKSSWQSEKMGNGSQTITKAEQDKSVESALDFGPMGTAVAGFELTPEATGTRVTWTLESDLGNNPVSRWFGPMIKSGVTKDYEKGLASLKQTVESGQ